MNGGSGQQLGTQLPPETRLVFSTACEDHALRAFELGVLDCLLKPCGAERFAATVERLRLAPAAAAGSASVWPTCNG